MIRRPPRSTQSRSSAASDVYKRQVLRQCEPLGMHVVILDALDTHRLERSESYVKRDVLDVNAEVPYPCQQLRGEMQASRRGSNGARLARIDCLIRPGIVRELLNIRGNLYPCLRPKLVAGIWIAGELEPVSYTHLRAH